MRMTSEVTIKKLKVDEIFVDTAITKVSPVTLTIEIPLISTIKSYSGYKVITSKGTEYVGFDEIVNINELMDSDIHEGDIINVVINKINPLRIEYVR